MRMKSLTTAFALAIGGLLAMGCSSMGTSPTPKDKRRFLQSNQYNREEGTFQNRDPHRVKQMEEKMEFWTVLRKMFFEDNNGTPKTKLPEVKPDFKEFLADSNELKTIWLGHSTFLLNMNGTVVLVDPVFSDYAAPVSFLVKRFQKPVVSLNELPEVDYIVISHDHYDHLDMKSVKHFKNKTAKFLTPLGVGSHLKGWGIPEDRIVEKDWWEEEQLGNIKFVATPAQHFSGRGVSDKNHTLWASWVIQSENHKVYFSGDSGYDTHFKDIGDKYGPFDIAFIESGQYNEMWSQVHLMPRNFEQAYVDLQAKSYFPVHWGMFKLSIHSWYEPIERLYKLAQEKKVTLHAPKIGEVLKPKNAQELDAWWRDLKIQQVTKN